MRAPHDGDDGVFDRGSGHEEVVFCQDRHTGLRAIIALYSTQLGPALGGTRFYPYPSEADALTDVLHLSRAMAYKNALAGLDLGGGKAVIIGDPRRDSSEALLRAYGRFVESLGGRYITACDVGTKPADMDVVARETRHVAGRSLAWGGSGDSSLLTAYGVLCGMRAAAEHVWGRPRLLGRRIGVTGVGKVGAQLVEYLLAEGATVVVHDIDERAVERVTGAGSAVEVAPDLDALLRADLDIFAPCAMSGALTDRVAATMTARIVCGGANSQLADEGVGKALHERGIWYVPDYVVNAGGVIQVADELGGFDLDRATARAGGIGEVVLRVLRLAAGEQILPGQAADRLAEQRISAVGGLRAPYPPRARS